MIKQLEDGSVVDLVAVAVDEPFIDRQILRIQNQVEEKSGMTLKEKPDEETLEYWNQAVLAKQYTLASLAQVIGTYNEKKIEIQSAKTIEPISIEPILEEIK